MPQTDALLPVLLQEFLDDEGPELRRLAFLLLGNWAEADQVLHQTAVTLVRTGSLENLPRALREARRGVLAQCRGRLDRAAPEALPAPVATAMSKDEESATEQEPTTAVLTTLRLLPFDERAALLLQRVCQLDDARVAEALETTEEHAATLVAGALGQLTSALRHQGVELEVRERHPPRPVDRHEGVAATTLEEVDF